MWQQGVQLAMGAGPDVMVQDWQNTGCLDCSQQNSIWHEPERLNSDWQDPQYEERSGPWLPDYDDYVKGHGWQGGPCNPDTPVFPTVYR